MIVNTTAVPKRPKVTPTGPSAIVARDLQALVFPPIAWVVPSLIPDGLTLLAGKPKLGKSWLMLDISVTVGRGAL